MGKLSSVMVDARDMTCAQALAQASLAIKRVESGAALEVICNAPDVKHDLLVWAKELQHEIVGTEERGSDSVVWVRRGPPPGHREP